MHTIAPWGGGVKSYLIKHVNDCNKHHNGEECSRIQPTPMVIVVFFSINVHENTTKTHEFDGVYFHLKGWSESGPTKLSIALSAEGCVSATKPSSSHSMLFLKLLLSGLYKLPLVSGVILYCGVKRNVSGQFCKGDEKTWWAVSSCTAKLKVLEKKAPGGGERERERDQRERETRERERPKLMRDNKK